jgi:hypothetical protein
MRSSGWWWARALALVAMLALVATACGSGGNDKKSSSSGGPVELTLEDHQKPRVELLRKLLPQFEEAMKAQGKQITVKLVEGPAEDGAFKSKLTLDYNSGNAPDVTSIGAADASSFAASGYLLDLTDRLNGWADWQHFYQRLREEAVALLAPLVDGARRARERSHHEVEQLVAVAGDGWDCSDRSCGRCLRVRGGQEQRRDEDQRAG